MTESAKTLKLRTFLGQEVSLDDQKKFNIVLFVLRSSMTPKKRSNAFRDMIEYLNTFDKIPVVIYNEVVAPYNSHVIKVQNDILALTKKIVDTTKRIQEGPVDAAKAKADAAKLQQEIDELHKRVEILMKDVKFFNIFMEKNQMVKRLETAPNLLHLLEVKHSSTRYKEMMIRMHILETIAFADTSDALGMFDALVAEHAHGNVDAKKIDALEARLRTALRIAQTANQRAIAKSSHGTGSS